MFNGRPARCASRTECVSSTTHRYRPRWKKFPWTTRSWEASGARAFTAFFCGRSNAGTPGPGGKGPGTFEYIGGTGKYKGLSGSNTFTGVTQVNWADGTASGYAIWNR